MTRHLRTIRGKVIAITLLVVLGSQVATVIAVLIASGRDMDNRAEQNLQEGSEIFQKLVANRGTLLQKVVRPLAADPVFINDFTSLDATAVSAELANRARWIGADIAVAIDASGKVTASSGEILPAGYMLSELTTVKHSGIAFGKAWYEMISEPLILNDQKVGWVAMGFAIDDQMARNFATITGLEMTLLADSGKDGSLLLGSSLSHDNRKLIKQTSDKIMQGENPREVIDAMRDKFLSVRVPYLPSKDTVFAVLQVPAAKAMAPFLALQGTLIHAAFTALLAAMIMALTLSRSISQPIKRLLVAARRMRVGNYSRRLDIRSRDEFGELARAFEAMRGGISEREKRIIYQAQFDDLTGLPNRNQAMELLRGSLRISNKTLNPVAVMIMHLQRFREIQSSLGHEIGDEVLQQVAKRMNALLEDSQILARLEGDQFMIIAPNTDRHLAKDTALKLASALDTSVNVRSVNVTLDACIGICISPEHGRQPDELIRRAAVAKNDAQQAQKKFRIYQNGREARHVRQIAILGDLRRAVDENELKLYLQPKVELRDTTVSGAEALLRWEHPELGQIPPHEFIPLAESAGSISIISEWVINRVMQQLANWKKIEIDLPIAINMSRRDLLNRKLPQLMQSKLDEYDVTPASVVLEITEEAVVHDIDRAAEVLNALRDMGFSISMDDFGTGYSSLGHLQKLPVDELKIDRAFVTNLPDERQNAAIVRSIIELAHNLAMEVVAEGVETTAALRWLREEGCERAQGYYLSKPMPARDFERWYFDWQRLAADQTESHDPGESLILRPRLIT